MSGTTRKSASVQSAKNVKSSAAELSARNQSLLSVYSAEIESAADKIIFASPSPVARRQALVWKTDAIPVLQNTMLGTDPVAAAVDTWAFIDQMKAYMDQLAVRQDLGQLQHIAIETLNKMEAQMEELVKAAAPGANIADLRKTIGDWADTHPVQSSLAGRESANAQLILRVKQADLGAVASIRGLQESLADITARLDAYNVYAAKQARWQAELMLGDVARDPQIGAAVRNLSTISNAAAKASGSMDRMPDLVKQAHAAVLADVQGQRLAAQDFLQAERGQVLNALQQERIAALATLRGERLAATSDLRGERQIVLDALHNEQVEAMNSFRQMSDEAVKGFDARSRGLIDHFFLRALELMLLTLVLFTLVAWLLLRRFALRRPDRGERVYDRAA